MTSGTLGRMADASPSAADHLSALPPRIGATARALRICRLAASLASCSSKGWPQTPFCVSSGQSPMAAAHVPFSLTDHDRAQVHPKKSQCSFQAAQKHTPASSVRRARRAKADKQGV